MSDFAIKFFIAFPCSDIAAERFYALHSYLQADDASAQLEPTTAAQLQASGDKTPEAALAEILSTGESLGVDCSYDSASQHLHIWSTDPTPDLHGLSVVLQRLYPEYLPIGFEWAYTCSRPRLDAYGGGYMVIHAHGIVQNSTHDLMISDLAATHYGSNCSCGTGA
jgi:hypothetical protein